ncbi:MAG: NADH-quinone oxidoreductase subunit E, partial [Rhodomicrobium sp.]
DLTPENFKALLDGLRKGRDMKPGPQIPRQFSAPAGGLTTLTNEAALGGAAHSAERVVQESQIQDKAQDAAGTRQGKTKDED